jgi:hypothetical protein
MMFELSRSTVAESIFYWQVDHHGVGMRREWNEQCREMVSNVSWLVTVRDFWDFHRSDVA